MNGDDLNNGSRFRSLAKTGLSYALSWIATSNLFEALGDSANMPLVLCYHRTVERIDPDTKDVLPSMLVTLQMLEAQLDCIGQRYRFVSLDELVTQPLGESKSREPMAAVTFDDGYRDVYYHAFPLLKRKRIPAAIFLATDFIGTANLLLHDQLFLLLSRAFSPQLCGLEELLRFLSRLGIELSEEAILRNRAWSHPGAASSLLTALSRDQVCRVVSALESKIRIEESARELNRALSWEMVEEMHRSGMTIGSHTKSHAVLINESFERIIDETQGARAELERRLGTKIRHIAYPDGQFNAAAIMAAAASGYDYGYTTCRHRDPIRPLLTIPRVVLWQNSCLDARGRFSRQILNCLIRGMFDFGLACERDHALREINLMKYETHEFHV